LSSPFSIFLARWRMHREDAVLQMMMMSWNLECLKSSNGSAKNCMHLAYSISRKVGKKMCL
jgi:hypothetical protein